MKTETKTDRFKFTWVHRGTRNAAMLGLDEIVETPFLQAAIEMAEYNAECQGVDLEKYELRAELIED